MVVVVAYELFMAHSAYSEFGGKNTQTAVANTRLISIVKIAYYNNTNGKRRRNASPFSFCWEREGSFLCINERKGKRKNHRRYSVNTQCCVLLSLS